MAEAVLIDMFSTELSSQNCINLFLRKAMDIVGKHYVDSDPTVYIMYCQTFGCDSGDAREIFVHAIRSFQGLRKRVELISNSSIASTLYNIQQKLDEKNVSRVKIILPVQRTCLMKAFIDRLFTKVYQFEFETLELNSGDQMGHAANYQSGAQTITETQLQLVESDIQMFLGSLLVKGELTILKSSLIPDSLFLHGFTTRYGGISSIPALSSMNLYSSSKRRDPPAVVAENLRRLAKAVGFNPKTFHLVKDGKGPCWVWQWPQSML
ncbi:hypothetical protein FKM82_009199 [Ascaphus truei]